jgi:hypothetical protein
VVARQREDQRRETVGKRRKGMKYVETPEYVIRPPPLR